MIVGISGAEYGIRGFVSAYDAGTGRLVWRFYTIPSPAEGGWWGKWSPTDAFGTDLHRDLVGEKADSAKYADAWKTGGGSVWQAPAVDRELGLVIFTVGNASPDLDGSVRPGDNLYTDCVVAVSSDRQARWYFQELPHDTWDLDAVSPVVLFDLPATARVRCMPWPRRGRPAGSTCSTARPASRSAGRMRSSRRRTFRAAHARRRPHAARRQRRLRMVGRRVQPRDRIHVRARPPPTHALQGQAGAAQAAGLLAQRRVLRNGEPQYGLFSAVDLTTGKIAWQDTVAEPMIGGALATAGGLVFTGTKDKQFLAFDARTGRQLWRYQANAGSTRPR